MSQYNTLNVKLSNLQLEQVNVNNNKATVFDSFGITSQKQFKRL